MRDAQSTYSLFISFHCIAYLTVWGVEPVIQSYDWHSTEATVHASSHARQPSFADKG